MGSLTATSQAEWWLKAADGLRTFWTLLAAGFRRHAACRHAACRHAAFAVAFTDAVFGFPRCYLLPRWLPVWPVGRLSGVTGGG